MNCPHSKTAMPTRSSAGCSTRKKQDRNANQIVRWVLNKEKHADDTAAIITSYFMAQRLKPVDKDAGAAYNAYIRKLTLLHEMLVGCMKTLSISLMKSSNK